MQRRIVRKLSRKKSASMKASAGSGKRKLSKRFSLDDAAENWDPANTKVGNLFSSKFWNHYDDYADRYSAIKGTLEDKYIHDDTFVEFLELRRGSSDFMLEDLLQLPASVSIRYDITYYCTLFGYH
ncbi:hypothetical protein ACF0H5_008449 [Mactra antiquata]